MVHQHSHAPSISHSQVIFISSQLSSVLLFPFTPVLHIIIHLTTSQSFPAIFVSVQSCTASLGHSPIGDSIISIPIVLCQHTPHHVCCSSTTISNAHTSRHSSSSIQSSYSTSTAPCQGVQPHKVIHFRLPHPCAYHMAHTSPAVPTILLWWHTKLAPISHIFPAGTGHCSPPALPKSSHFCAQTPHSSLVNLDSNVSVTRPIIPYALKVIFSVFHYNCPTYNNIGSFLPFIRNQLSLVSNGPALLSNS